MTVGFPKAIMKKTTRGAVLPPQIQKGVCRNMKKTMIVEGMMCVKCKGRVERALNAIEGVSAEVDLASKTASLTLTREVADEVLTAAVTDAGFQVISIASL